MKLSHLHAQNYRSLRDVQFDVGPVTVLIGPNGCGKSNIMDALSFVAASLRAKDFAQVADDDGGFAQMVWRGAETDEIVIEMRFDDAESLYVWRVALRRAKHGFEVSEQLDENRSSVSARRLLDARGGTGWWRSNQVAGSQEFHASSSPTACMLSAACADASFPGRKVGQFVAQSGLYILVPALMGGPFDTMDAARLASNGSNLPARLRSIGAAPGGTRILQRITTATRRSLGLSDSVEIQVSDRRVSFEQPEGERSSRWRHPNASEGMVRVLALMTALFDGAGDGLVMIDEPELHLHPTAIASFVGYLREASAHTQICLSTHQPLLVDALGRPEEILFVRRSETGTVVERDAHPDISRREMEKSGLGLGMYVYRTTKFGA